MEYFEGLTMTLQELYDGLTRDLEAGPKDLSDAEVYLEMCVNSKHHIEKLRWVATTDSCYINENDDHKLTIVLQGESLG
jgi:hypothetical protein